MKTQEITKISTISRPKSEWHVPNKEIAQPKQKTKAGKIIKFGRDVKTPVSYFSVLVNNAKIKNI